jgi:hypothetical protein
MYNVWLLELKPSMESKKGRELDPAKFSREEKEAFDIADKEQRLKHLRTGAVEVVPLKKSKEILKNSREPVVTGYARFVRTSKGKGDGELKASSRMVLPGHRIDSSSYRTDSPTVSQVALHLVLFLAASSRWLIGSFDVSSAFLTGKMMARTLYFRQPREGLPGVPQGCLIKALKGLFGIPEAPRLWWLRALEVIAEAGFEAVRACAGLFVLRDAGRLVGILALHVDDALWAGSGKRYEKARQHIRHIFP